MRKKPKASLHPHKDGAIFVELLIVVLPFLMLLFGLAQVAWAYLGGLAVQRSAATAARAAMVVLDDDPKYYGGQGRNTLGGQREEAIKIAASFPLYAVWTSPKSGKDNLEESMRAWEANPYKTQGQAMDGLTLDFPNGSPGGRGSPVTVEVTYEFPCEVPMARAFVCNGGKLTIKAKSTLPNHAANYEYGAW